MFIFGKVNGVEKELAEIKKTNKVILDRLDRYEEDKDRVDISLREYEGLKCQNENMASTIDSYERLFEALGIAVNVVDFIVPDTVHVYESQYLYCDPLTLRKRIRIEFDVEEK